MQHENSKIENFPWSVVTDMFPFCNDDACIWYARLKLEREIVRFKCEWLPSLTMNELKYWIYKKCDSYI